MGTAKALPEALADGADIPDLIQPILNRRAQFVVGDRPIPSIEHFSRTKRLLQKLGSGVVKRVSGTPINDAPSGFRALTRDAAMQINIFDNYTYTLESIIQAGLSNIRIVSVPDPGERGNPPVTAGQIDWRLCPAVDRFDLADLLRVQAVQGVLLAVALAPLLLATS